MSPRTALATSLRGWRCPQCTHRAFTTTQPASQVSPEHPRYIDIPEPPQQTVPDRPPVKGTLPVPRDVFAGRRDVNPADDAEIDKATPRPAKDPQYPAGSRKAWKARVSENRRRNLREGVKSLKARQEVDQARMQARMAQRSAERDELVRKPESESERLTTPSHGLDLEKLLHGPIEDPTREARLAVKRANVAQHAKAKQVERLDSMHTLYMRAREFVVTPQQLETALDEAFGTLEHPVVFGNEMDGASVWAEGKPMSVQDMLTKASRDSMDANGDSELNRDRMKRIAEMLTGGKMDEKARRIEQQ